MHKDDITKKEEIQPSPVYIHTPSVGTTDFAIDQYGTKHAIEQPKENQYPDRTDSTASEYYGRKRKC